MSDPYDVVFHLTDCEADDVDCLLAECLDTDLATTADGRTDLCESYWSSRYGSLVGNKRHNVDFDTAVSEMAADRQAMIHLWYDEQLQFSLTIDCDPEADPITAPRAITDLSEYVIELNFGPELLRRDEETDHSIETRERVNAIVDAVAAITRSCEPEYAWGGFDVNSNPYQDALPEQRPIRDHVDGISWITVIAPELLDEFGGRDWVLDAPAWLTRELDTGHVVVVKTNNPIDPTDGPTESLDEYLIEGKRVPGSGMVRDPFEDLPDGSLGIDVVVRDTVNGELTDDDDVDLVRCEVRGNHLYDVDTGRFHRRIVNPGGQPIGDLPDDTDREEEPYSVLLEIEVPAEFIQLADPDDEPVVSKIVELDVDIDTIEILAHMGAVADDAEGRALVRDLVDRFVAHQHEDGIEDVIRNRILFSESPD